MGKFSSPKCQSLSHVSPLVTPWTVACQASLSMGFSMQEYLSRLSVPFSRFQAQVKTQIFKNVFYFKISNCILGNKYGSLFSRNEIFKEMSVKYTNLNNHSFGIRGSVKEKWYSMQKANSSAHNSTSCQPSYFIVKQKYFMYTSCFVTKQ